MFSVQLRLSGYNRVLYWRMLQTPSSGWTKWKKEVCRKVGLTMGVRDGGRRWPVCLCRTVGGTEVKTAVCMHPHGWMCEHIWLFRYPPWRCGGGKCGQVLRLQFHQTCYCVWSQWNLFATTLLPSTSSLHLMITVKMTTAFFGEKCQQFQYIMT
jgi:hypothetical protein